MKVIFENTITKPYYVNTLYVLEDNRTYNKESYYNDENNKKLIKVMWTHDEFWVIQEGERQLAIPLTLEDVLKDELPEDLYWDHP